MKTRNVELTLQLTINLVVGDNPEGDDSIGPEIEKINMPYISINGNAYHLPAEDVSELLSPFNDDFLEMLNHHDTNEICEMQRDAAINKIMDKARRLRR